MRSTYYNKLKDAHLTYEELSYIENAIIQHESSKLNFRKYLKIFLCLTVVLCSLSMILMGIGYFVKHYSVWSARMSGKADFAKAESTRQIIILEAKAKKDSAVELSEAEILRAKGVATANKIIGDSLKENEGYLRYLWIQSLEHSEGKVIYIPTEAGLPILESQRLLKK